MLFTVSSILMYNILWNFIFHYLTSFIVKRTPLHYAETKYEPTLEWPNVMVLKLWYAGPYTLRYKQKSSNKQET
jgi:hypothetical protein